MDEGFVKAEFGFALDSNGAIGDIAVAAPGQYKLNITFKGRSAHAGVNPEDGISAITVAAKAVSRMRLGRIDKETTANIGSFFGGGETNVVCDQVTLKAEARSIDKDKLEKQVNAMYEACESTAKEMGAKLEFVRDPIYPAFVHGDDSSIVQLAGRAIRSIGLTPRTFHSGGGSDANVFNGMGIPTVNLAVGYKDIHTVNEHIAVDDLVKTTEVVVAIVKETVK
jgi:tripeptide aminopeptidase